MFAFDTSIPVGTLVETEYEARQWMNRFLETHWRNGGLGLDTETTGLKRHRDSVIVWSLSDGIDRICLPSQFIGLFKEPILENPDINFDFTNARFDAHMMANSGADLTKAGEWRDTVVQSWLYNENNQGRHGLKECVRDHFGRATPSFESIFGKVPPKKRNKQKEIIFEVTVGDLIRQSMGDPLKREGAADYASLDAYNSTALRKHFDGLLAQQYMFEGMDARRFFYDVECKFTRTLYSLERRGITVDGGYLQELEGPMVKEMERIEREFIHASGEHINLNSPQDVGWFFFELLKKVPIKMTKGGTKGIKKASTDKEVLEEWEGQGDPWAKLILEHRRISKIYGTYVRGLQNWIDHRYRIHTSLNQTGTVTGRLSSSEPNLQNIPRPNKDKFKIRDAFVPAAYSRLVVMDYAQLEMRLMAHFSGDEKMIRAIHEGIDLHCLSVSEMYGIPYDEVIGAVKAEKALKSKKRIEPLSAREEELLNKRQACKATGFGIIYGIGGKKLAHQLTAEGDRIVTPEEGNRLIDQWFGVFPGVKSFTDHTKREMKRVGFVQTLMGRFRRFGDIRGMSKKDAAQAERQAVNAIIQGSAADVAKMAMLRAEEDPALEQLQATLLMQIHDELLWECPDDEETYKAVQQRGKEIMELPFGVPLKVPLLVDPGSGYTWATAK